MRLVLFISMLLFLAQGNTQSKEAKKRSDYPSVESVRMDFRKLLLRPTTDLKPSFETIKTDSVIIERGFIYTEATEKVPVLIYKPVNKALKSFPVVICLHGTGGSKEDESIKQLMYYLTRAGIMGVAIDARFHGERVEGGAIKAQQYVEAISKAWENTVINEQTHPFYFDTVYDLWRLTDFLITRPDVQASRIGMMGISMGGIETWMAASVDERIKVAVPVIAAQSFEWSLENNKWQGRAQTIWKVHEQASRRTGDSVVTKENVRLVWTKLIPGITDKFDCPSMIRLFAPRPLLLLNNEKDQNCPLEGAQIAFQEARNAYRLKNAPNKLQIHVTPNEPHRFLPQHEVMTIAFFKKWL